MAEEKKGNKKSRIIITILLLLIFAGAGTFGGAYFFMSKNNSEFPLVIEESFFEVGEIFVNLSDEGSKRYVKLNMSISYDKANKELAKEIEEKSVVIRDVSIFYIKACTAKDFDSVNEVILKGDLIAKINDKLTKGVLKDIYISDIIVQ